MSACDEYWQEILPSHSSDGSKYLFTSQFYEFLGNDAYIIIKKRNNTKLVEENQTIEDEKIVDVKMTEFCIEDIMKG